MNTKMNLEEKVQLAMALHLKNLMLILKSLHLNRAWNSLKKSKFQKGKF